MVRGDGKPEGNGRIQLPSGFPSPLTLTLDRSTSQCKMNDLRAAILTLLSAACVDRFQCSSGGVWSLRATVSAVSGRLPTPPDERYRTDTVRALAAIDCGSGCRRIHCT